MNAKKLRIGNLAKDSLTNEILICSGLLCDSDGKNSKIIFSVLDRSKYPLPDGWQAEPILIDEEWLKRFGFIKRYEDCYELGQFILNDKFIMMDIDITVKLKYVHQLQNLYFVLLDKELTLVDGF